MSNLNNVYAVCPGLMSDGRAQPTDYTSHNELLKKMINLFFRNHYQQLYQKY